MKVESDLQQMFVVVPFLLPLGAVVLVIAVIFNIIRERLSSLSSLPNAGIGAPYSRLLWAFPTEFRGLVTLDLPRLHEKLGPLVRIGPNEVSFYSLDIYDAVHKVGSKFKKDPRVYGEFVQGGNPALFSITDPAEHSKRRRLMGQLFNRSQMHKLEGLMLHHISSFVQLLAKSKHEVDLTPACRALEADIISDFSFGHTIGAIAAYSQGEQLTMVAKNDEKATWMPLLVSFPGLCDLWERLERLVFSATGIRTAYSSTMHQFHSWAESSWRSTLSIGSVQEKPPSPFPNLVATMVNSGLPPLTALSEATENLGPGTDTTSASLAHILWALAHNSAFQEELFKDLAHVSFSSDMTTLENIPKLRACVKEGIRWTGAAAAMLPRIVPEGGVEFYGHFIPEGTVLSSSPIWYLHDHTAFPGPKEFDPYRWLTTDGLTTSEDALRDRFYIPFSKGANVCMGAHFAYLELYLSLSQIIRNFRIQVHPSLQQQQQQHPYYFPQGTSPPPAAFWRVGLPARREWVAAVPTERLAVTLQPRA
ncbi:cytochrome P450 [Truncatella angustata]|uniref:Cytochrome P450 n=1 Tax=Truncatella angustata TaxID=152316 RepID=A0A9P8UVD9_9PEZI|nr:cytochrome P450 [Truncatella angustata]KAH6659035.1 cytochrome P450 [Truncatella angustata]